MSNQPAQSTDPRQQTIPMSNTAANADGLPPIISEILSAMPTQKAGLSNRSRYELLKSQIAPGCSDDELALFLDVANARGLSPWARQIFARRQRTWDNDKQDYVMKMIIITSIDGFRLKASRTREHTRTSDAEFTHGATVTPLNPAGIERVSITVFRKSEPFTATVYWSELSQTYKKQGVEHLSTPWAKMPHGMLEKCVEAKALRRAFPEEFSDLYVDDEIGHGATDTGTTPAVSNGGTTAPANAAPQATSQIAAVTPKKDPVAETPEWLAKEAEATELVKACKTRGEVDAAMKRLGKLLPKSAPQACRQRVGQLLADQEEAIAKAVAAQPALAVSTVDPQAPAP